VNPTGRYILPEFRERSATGERVHNPYTKLFEERIIFLGVQIDDASADDVMAQLLCLESMDPDRDIQIYINSPGGSYTAMTAIYDTIQFVKPQVQTVCLGQAASAAAVILAAGTPGKRFALPHARILIHQPYTEGAEMEGILAKHSGRTPEQVAKDIERDKILTAADAKEYGLIDAVISSRKA
jgi:ATP-dependent Clp protease, protease subunit